LTDIKIYFHPSLELGVNSNRIIQKQNMAAKSRPSDSKNYITMNDTLGEM